MRHLRAKVFSCSLKCFALRDEILAKWRDVHGVQCRGRRAAKGALRGGGTREYGTAIGQNRAVSRGFFSAPSAPLRAPRQKGQPVDNGIFPLFPPFTPVQTVWLQLAARRPRVQFPGSASTPDLPPLRLSFCQKNGTINIFPTPSF
jgi:hypothetical protein